MLRILKKLFSFFSIKSIFLVIFSMAVFWYAVGHFIFVRAANDQINIYPDRFSLSQDEEKPIWQNAGLSFYQDLSPQAGLSQFLKDNSAWIAFNQEMFVEEAATNTSESIPPLQNLPEENMTDTGSPDVAPLEKVAPSEETMPGEPILEVNKNPEIIPDESLIIPETPIIAPTEEIVPIPTETIAPVPAETIVPAENTTSLLKNLILAKDGLKKLFSSMVNFGQARADEINKKQTEQSIIFSGFSVPLTQKEALIDNAQLRLSLAGRSSAPEDKIYLEYSLDDISWIEAGAINLREEVSNDQNGGYFLFGLPIFSSWEDVSKIKIKISFASDSSALEKNNHFEAYIDALWLEVNTKEASGESSGDKFVEEEEKLQKEVEKITVKNDEYDFLLTSGKKDFKSGEKPQFKFNFKKKRGLAGTLGHGFLNLFYDEYKDIDIKTEVEESGYTRINNVNPQVRYLSNGEFTVDLPDLPRQFKPGTHKIKVTISDPSLTNGLPVDFIQDFSWGVLALNTSKSIYLPTETVYLQIGVLDDSGHTLCHADLDLEITAPDGGIAYLNTGNGLVTRNPECGPDNVINTPDYFAFYGLAGTGIYQVRLVAYTANGLREIVDQFEVRDSVPFDVERTGPTRIYPVADYEMRIKIKANEDYDGDITEIVPEGFKISNSQFLISKQFPNFQISNSLKIENLKLKIEQGEQKLIWENVNIKAGDEIDVSYRFDAPDISPEFFLLGPLRIGGFQEIRKWQIASDAVVSYSANSGASVGVWTNAARAWDSVNNNWASGAVPGSTDDMGHYLQASSTNIADLGANYKITKVEIGIEGYVSNTSCDARQAPVFGAILGVSSSTAQFTAGGSDNDIIYYLDVTADANGPGAANWTWADAQNLKVRAWGKTTTGTGRTIYFDQLYIRITYNNPPTSTIASLAQKTDGTGAVDVSVKVSDLDGDNLTRGKLEYATGTTCSFGAPGDPTLNMADASTTSTFGDAKIDNAQAYQVGSSTGWILTSSGENTVNFDWSSGADLPNVEGEYCVRFTANDQTIDQVAGATSTLVIDNKAPSAPGALSVNNITTSTVMLNFGATSSDGYFKEYKIYYSTSSPVMDSGAGMYEFSSSTNPGDADLGSQTFNGQATTTISGLNADTLYYFNIFAYDQYGNKSSSTQISAQTVGNPPTGIVNSVAQKMDGSGAIDISTLADDPDNNDVRAKLLYVAGSDCNFASPSVMTIDTNPANISATYGTVLVDNASPYQVGTSTGWITTASGANTVNFDWLSRTDIPSADGIYCVKMTVNDGAIDQSYSSTTLVTIDNVDPTAPGQLSATSTGLTVTLTFGSEASDNHFSNYKIFYKQGTSSVSEADTEKVDSNLDYVDYNGAVSTVISGLTPDTDYVFNIWSYDTSGNRASSTEVAIKTMVAEMRANTVKFLAGVYVSPDGLTGQYSNATNTLPDFNFRLAEKDVQIRDAYIVLEMHFAAYSGSNANYDAYSLSFDACQGACTPVATSSLVDYDASGIAYSETTYSNMARVIMNVTDEAEIAGYSGNNENMKAEIAYMVHQASSVNSISLVKAYLVLTYAYDQLTADSYTNTVSYPLESTAAGDSGSRLALQTNNCTKDLDCPKFGYNMYLPEVSSSSQRLSQWFETENQDDIHATTDVNAEVNIEGINIDSTLLRHEASIGGTQGNTMSMVFDQVSGFSENSSQQLEYHAMCADAGSNYYLLGGETTETYIASTSAATKTRTVSFPLGVLNDGNTTAQFNKAINVYFPENGSGSGNVTIKKAWFRVISSNRNDPGTGPGTDYSITVTDKVGDNATSSAYAYRYNPGTTLAKIPFRFNHVIPSSDYAELALANAASSKSVNLGTLNSINNSGGLSAELMITYVYTDESNGHLTSLSLFAGQSKTNGDTRSTTTPTSLMVLPETTGTSYVRAGGLLAYYLAQDSDAGVANANWTFAANLATGTPTCSNHHIIRPDSRNAFTEYMEDVAGVLLTIDGQSYNACYSNNGGADANSGGAKMNGVLTYTYQNTAPSQQFTQNDWRWYDNVNLALPTTPKAVENTAISNINLGDIVRLRMNVVDGVRYLATSSQAFKLQFGWGADCSTVSNWTDVGGIGSSTSWRAYDNIGVTAGASASSTLLASSTVIESYEEGNPSSANLKRLNVGSQGEWDWTLYNNSATSSQQYCFRMTKSDGTIFTAYNTDGYPIINTAAANTAPNNAASLGQFTSTSTPITNGAWIGTTTVMLQASATDVNMSEQLRLYFQFIYSTSTFATATSEPASWCASGIAYGSCGARIWRASSTIGDYRTSPYTGSTTIAGIPDSISTSTGYKWQVLVCDDSGVCSGWVNFGTAPNLKIDSTNPTSPGALTFADKTATSVTVNFGSSTTETNFSKYRIFYKIGSSGVAETDNERIDSNLNYLDYNGATTTVISGLSAGTQYVFNIWAYDSPGNKASSTAELVVTTISSFTPPDGTINSIAQKTDGSGALDISIMADDPDNDDTLRAQVEYVAYSGSCDFAAPLDPTIDTADANTYAYIHGSFDPAGDPKVDNSAPYQIGTTTGWIITSPGASDVFFDWLSKSDIPDANGTYCVRITVNDGMFTEATSSVQMIIIDNLAPAVPGALTFNSRTSNQLKLNFGAQSSDTHFSHYKIYYATSSPVTESGTEHADGNLDYLNYNGATTTIVSNLAPGVLYYFNIWAFDDLGNKASSTQLAVSTDAIPGNASSTIQYKNDGVTAISNGSWTTESSVKLEASVNDADTSELLTLYFQLIPNASSFLTATSQPSGACVSGTAYTVCASGVWLATSSSGDYSATPYTGTVSIPSITDSAAGYKWQVLACDDDGVCSNSWTKFNVTAPNFKVDTVAPTAPGALSENSKTANSINLDYGATTSEANFQEYRIYYATTSVVSETDYLHGSSTDANLGYINYNGISFTAIDGLQASTTYYFAIYAYDLAGNKASSSVVSIKTNSPQSTPGVIFYTKNTRVLYYKIWDGTAWSAERTGPTVGSAAGDNIRQIRTIRSDDGARIGIIIKTWDTVNQEFWGTVYAMAADNFSTASSSLQTVASANYAGLMDADIVALSGGSFMAAKGKITAAGTTIFTWDGINSWVNQGNGPNPGQIITGLELTRRPSTDNYLLALLDASANVNTSYYYGGSSYANSWTTVTLHSSVEYSINNFVGDAFFDQTDNTRGALNFTNSATAAYTRAKYFSVTSNSIAYGVATASPSTWTANFVHGEFMADPSGAGLAFYSGRNSTGELNTLKMDISGGSPVWSITTNGDNVSASGLYADTNFSQKPFANIFYKNNKGVLSWLGNASTTPKYRVVDMSANTIDSGDTAVPGATSSIWSRVRFVKDPNEQEFVSVYQNSQKDYAVAFWDGANNRFYNTVNNPGSGQVWTDIATTTGNFSYNDECVSYAFGKINSAPVSPTALIQYKSDATTTISNGGWTNQNQLVLKASASDPDTSEVVILYFNFIATAGAYATSTTQPTNACNIGTPFASCASQIWSATSTLSDYSITPFIGTTSITAIPDSATGYKWQVLACDDQAKCSGWTAYNATTPNVKVDTVVPSAAGALTIGGKNSSSITLLFGATTTEANFSTYKIYYKQGASGVTEADTQQNDSNLGYINYNSQASSTVVSLASSTQYVFNIWVYDLAGNKATATPEISTTTNAAPFIRQVSYIFENDNGANVNSNTGAGSIDTALLNVSKGERLNLRIQLDNTGGDIYANKVYRLQYENQTDNPGAWNDVGASSQISYSSGLSGANGDIISSSKAAANGGTFIYGSWHENTNLTNSFTILNGQYTEFVYAIQTGNALLGKVYRFRLYNNTDVKVLDNYAVNPQLTIISPETKRFSKGAYASLLTTTAALTYHLDPQGYGDTATDDASRDWATSTANIPVYNFTIATTTNTKALIATWNGQSSVSATTKTVYLQAYRFGATNAWVTVATNTTASVDTDFNLSGSVNYHVSEYYDGSNLTYWRVYQDSGTQVLRTDYFNISFSDPVAEVRQIHNRWRNDNGSETTATWRELEDYGDPTDGTSTDKMVNIRLRFEVANTGGGSAANYAYRLEYAPTASNCASDPGGWLAMPITATTEHFEMATSSNFADGASTTAQLANTEGYVFTTGRMVEEPSSTTTAITLLEDRYTEVEYVFFATASSTSGGTYCFRVTDAGAALNVYAKLAELTVAGVTNPTPFFLAGTFPSDNGSTSTLPTDYGSNVVFTGTASTTDGGDYYLAICKTNSITAGNDAPPTCNGGEWCISGLASSTAEASCNYAAATSSEELIWYGFACDKHPGTGVADCSAMSQGDYGDTNDSPFNINHPPVFTNIYTSVNNLDPGGTFIITSTSSDTDVNGEADTLSLYVCLANSATYSGCTGGAPNTVCSAVATSSPNAVCNYTSPIPATSTVTSYWAFIFDSHNMPAAANSRTNTYTINNVAPSLGSLFLNSGSNITLGIKGAGDTQIQVAATTTDLNGCGTLVSATGVIYFSNVAGGYGCAANNNNCYQINSANCALSGCSGTIGTYACTANMKYYAIPTDDYGSNPNEPYNWLGRMTVYDGVNYSATSSAGVELYTGTALDVTESTINFGSDLFAGQNTGATNQPTTVVNSGNAPINSNIKGTDMNGDPAGTIGVGNIKWGLLNFDWSATGTPLSGSFVEINIEAPKATSTTDVSDLLYWGVGVPFGSPVSTYSGYNTFEVVIDPTNW